MQDVRIPLSAFQPAALLLVPRPYPGFLPLQHKASTTPGLKLPDAEVLQVVWDAAIPTTGPLSVDIESVILR
jgi:hypothetical protein